MLTSLSLDSRSLAPKKGRRVFFTAKTRACEGVGGVPGVPLMEAAVFCSLVSVTLKT